MLAGKEKSIFATKTAAIVFTDPTTWQKSRQIENTKQEVSSFLAPSSFVSIQNTILNQINASADYFRIPFCVYFLRSASCIVISLLGSCSFQNGNRKKLETGGSVCLGIAKNSKSKQNYSNFVETIFAVCTSSDSGMGMVACRCPFVRSFTQHLTCVAHFVCSLHSETSANNVFFSGSSFNLPVI